MIYTDFDSLMSALSKTDINDAQAMESLKPFFEVYTDALYNPPLGVIGVGAITYAESALVAFQTEYQTAKGN